MRFALKGEEKCKAHGNVSTTAYGVDSEGSRAEFKQQNHATKINKFLNVFMFFFVVVVLFLLAAGVYSCIHTWRLRWDFILFQNATHIFASNGIPHGCRLHLFSFVFVFLFIHFFSCTFIFVSLWSHLNLLREMKKKPAHSLHYITHTHTHAHTNDDVLVLPTITSNNNT